MSSRNDKLRQELKVLEQDLLELRRSFKEVKQRIHVLVTTVGDVKKANSIRKEISLL